MAVTYTWTIPTCEHDIATGGINVVHWRCTGVDDDGNVVTEAVMGTRSVPDYQGIDQSKLVPLLTAALQEALTKIDALETRITALEG